MVNEKKPKAKKNVSLGNMVGGRIQFRDIEELLTRPVKAYGNSGHVIIPKKHIDKEVQITVWRDQPNKKEEAAKE